MLNYKENININYQDVDYSGTLKLNHLLDHFSNIATTHAIKIGVWSQNMVEHYGWILAKMHLEIKQPIKTGNYELETYPGQASKVIFPRYYRVLQDNQCVVEASSIWTLLDLQKRRITMPSRVGIQFPEVKSLEHEVALPQDLPTDIPYCFSMSRTVLYGDVDTNQHMNNARYIEWACDLVDYDYFKDHFIDVIDIFFKHEIEPHSLVELYYYQEEDTFYIKGVCKNQVCFEMMMHGKLK